MFFGHGHANGHALFLRVGHIARVVHAGRDPGFPEVGQVGLQAQRGHGRKSHGDRATVAGLHLGVQVSLGGARHMGAGSGRSPG